MNGRNQVRQHALENGYELSTPYGLDTFTRPDGRKVEIDYARGGVRIMGIWINNELQRGATRKDTLAALRDIGSAATPLGAGEGTQERKMGR